MTDLKKKTVLVYDYGQFVELAVTLSKSFGRTLYYAPWTGGGAPTSRILRVGDGFPKVERVKYWEPLIDDIDLFVFPDVYDAPLQQYLVSLGKNVWGCRAGAELELDRVAAKKLLKALGIDVPPYVQIIGFDALRAHLKTHKDQWVKISETRGDMETFHSPDYAAVEQRLDELAHTLGAKKKVMQFVVEQGVPDAVEVGYDGYAIDGQFPQTSLVGVEVKCEAYVGRTMRYAQLPQAVQSVNDKLAPALKRYGYRGFLSTEIRCKGDKAYLIDPCARCGSPPSELYQVMIENLGEILWEGAQGIVVEPEYRARWGAMVMLNSEWAEDNWQQVRFPDAIRERVKLHNATVIDGEYYVIPHSDGRSQIGAVIGMGDSAQAAIADCEKAAEQVKGLDLKMPTQALEQARDQLAKVIGPQKPASRLHREAEMLHREGRISDKQLDRVMARG